MDHQRFATEHLGVYVYEEASPDACEQIFFDVADNALGRLGARRHPGRHNR